MINYEQDKERPDSVCKRNALRRRTNRRSLDAGCQEPDTYKERSLASMKATR